MLDQTYKSFNLQPSTGNLDMKAFWRVLDTDGDGAVTLNDLESLCNKYLCNFNAGSFR